MVSCKERVKLAQHRSGFGKTLMNLLYAQYFIERGSEVIYICRDAFLKAQTSEVTSRLGMKGVKIVTAEEFKSPTE
jgi:hypothetical protein